MTRRERESRRWWRQACRDLESAQINADNARHEVTCFLCQQAAEKALKAFLYAQGESPVIGHSLLALCARAAGYVAAFANLREAAKTLDAYYVPSRYPNGLSGDMAPADFFDAADSARGLTAARAVVHFVASHLPPAAAST